MIIKAKDLKRGMVIFLPKIGKNTVQRIRKTEAICLGKKLFYLDLLTTGQNDFGYWIQGETAIPVIGQSTEVF